MDIQQWEKESFEAYVHQFKAKAKGCNFTYHDATIRIFVKGLKMLIVWQQTSMKKAFKHSLTPSQKWRSLMLHSSSQK